MTSSTPSLTTTKPSVIWTTYSFTPPLLQTIGESPERYSRPSIPTSYSSDQRNASSNVKRWTALGFAGCGQSVTPWTLMGSITMWSLEITKVKDIQSFIGFVNFYWRFICNFSEIACPLHVLTQKSKDWSWGAAEQQAFDVLKSAITSAPTLAFPSKSGPFHLECDASNFATGAILSQQQEDRLFHLIGFMSKSFSDMERNYQIHDKEMLVIMCALEEWRHFLEGSNQKFEIHTDHKN